MISVTCKLMEPFCQNISIQTISVFDETIPIDNI